MKTKKIITYLACDIETCIELDEKGKTNVLNVSKFEFDTFAEERAFCLGIQLADGLNSFATIQDGAFKIVKKTLIIIKNKKHEKRTPLRNSI